MNRNGRFLRDTKKRIRDNSRPNAVNKLGPEDLVSIKFKDLEMISKLKELHLDSTLQFDMTRVDNRFVLQVTDVSMGPLLPIKLHLGNISKHSDPDIDGYDYIYMKYILDTLNAFQLINSVTKSVLVDRSPEGVVELDIVEEVINQKMC